MLRTMAFLFFLTLLGCRSDQLPIRHIEQPGYPLRARFENAQGTVRVKIYIAADGSVTFAKGSGAPDVLVQAAEENVLQWAFGPFPRASVFPIEHTVQYAYKLEGKPQIVGYEPTVKTFLPDRIEISATPLVSDYPQIEEVKPIARRK